MTVIMLDNDEASALADALEKGIWRAELDDLTNAMLGEKMAFAYEEPVTNWDRPEPPWKDEPTSDYRVA